MTVTTIVTTARAPVRTAGADAPPDVGDADGTELGATDGAGDSEHWGINEAMDWGTRLQKADPSAHPGPVGSPPHVPMHATASVGSKAQYDGTPDPPSVGELPAAVGASVVLDPPPKPLSPQPGTDPTKSTGTTEQRSNPSHPTAVEFPPQNSIHAWSSAGNAGQMSSNSCPPTNRTVGGPIHNNKTKNLLGNTMVTFVV
jgi:hypothetical protein